jgi:hypothetical protein
MPEKSIRKQGHALCVFAVTSVSILAAIVSSAEATPRGSIVGEVTACSQHGRGCIRQPVRKGRRGYEVRMPGGTWIGCRRSCSRTLREESLDFFETMRDRVMDR